jgi:MtaA/CmuA family methyltransferase
VDQGPAIREERAALTDKERLKTFQIPDPTAPGRMNDRVRAIELMRKRCGPGMSIVGWVEGPLALAAELRGLNNLMTDFADDPDFVRHLLDFTAQVAMRYAPVQIEAGADTIGMSDAAASLIGPRLYEEFLFPLQLRVLDSIRARYPKVTTRIHMCGDTNPLTKKMRELDAGIYELDFPVNLKQGRANLDSKVICGNISTITDLLEGTPDQVYEAARRCHQTCGRHHIVGAGCEVSPLTPPENLRALFTYAREHRPDEY